MYFFRKKSAVYVIYSKNGKLVPIPRDDLRHLDALPDDQVKIAVKRLEALYTVRKARPDLVPCPVVLEDLVDRFVAHRRSEGADELTLRHYKTCLRAAGGFMGWPLAAWPDRSRGFAEWSIKFLKPWMQKRCRMYLRLFWRWAVFEGLAVGEIYIRPVRNPVNPTPLKFTVTPDQVLAWKLSGPNAELVALLGYFFSLRTQEIFGLRKSDFAAGSSTGALECCKVLAEIGIKSRLAVHVDRQKSRTGVEPVKVPLSDETYEDEGEVFFHKEPKGGSRGWVACFDERAAKRILELVKQIPNDEIFEHHLDWQLALWRREGVGLTIKDLRRSSIYWLGHYSKINLIQLKNHARHSNISTTELYFRRPDSDVKRGLDLDE